MDRAPWFTRRHAFRMPRLDGSLFVVEGTVLSDV
jgi:hypothetical protein